MVVPILHHSGKLKPKPVVCPGIKDPKPTFLPLEQLRSMDVETFARHAAELNPTYAYSLGFLDNGQYQPPMKTHVGMRSLTPLMADALCDGADGNSLNHGGEGQNVLFQDGHVKFVKVRSVGYEGDDIYWNKAYKVAAGLDRFDTVLGYSAAKP
jgi:prepilin-type processing-associated H-X9-DG protein